MQDLYVDPDMRENGIARRMVMQLSDIGKSEKWARMYWLAESDNAAAQALYKSIGMKLDFTLHMMAL